MAIDLIVEARLWSQYITQCLAIISKKKCVFTHTYACAHKHTLLRTQAHIHTHTHTRTHTQNRASAHAHTHIHTHTHAYTHTHTHTHTRARARTHTHARAHTHTHTHTHTRTHTYIRRTSLQVNNHEENVLPVYDLQIYCLLVGVLPTHPSNYRPCSPRLPPPLPVLPHFSLPRSTCGWADSVIASAGK